jgi:diguanylate cyclase (GGDEF)-like protein
MATEADAEEAVTIAERIRRSVAGSPIRLDSGEYVSMSVSIGIATFPEDAGTAGDLMLAADTALYRAKAAGRDQVRQADSTPGSAATSPPTPTDPPAS